MAFDGIDGKIALVTGAAAGIGAAVVRLLHAHGASVAAIDIDENGLAELAAELGDRVRTGLVDVSNSAAVDAFVAQVEQDWGPIELAASVAGVLAIDDVVNTTDEEWRRVFDVNTHGVFHVGRALATRMTPRKRGSIVVVSSNAAGVPRQRMAAYAASKAAATMFTRCLGLELAPHGIRCNIVAPGSTRTAMQTGMWAGDPEGEQRILQGAPEAYRTGIPLGKLATPEDIANAVVFLLSDQAGHVTMADLFVDGGATLCV